MTAEEWHGFDALARSRSVGLITAGNFSVASAVQKRLCEFACASGMFKDWEIIDRASERFPQVPTSTAREIADSLQHVGSQCDHVPLEELIGERDARGALVSGTRVHSLRSAGTYVSTDVVFGRQGETLTVGVSCSDSASLYVPGTIIAIQRVTQTRGLIRGLDRLLWDDAPRTAWQRKPDS